MSSQICLINSIRNKNDSADAVNIIISVLSRITKYKLLHDHVSSMNQNKLNALSKSQNIEFHKKIFSNIRQADLLISECSYESLSVGYLLSYGLQHEKPLIIFYKKGIKLPNLFPTLSEENKVYLVEYENISELESLVIDYVNYALENLESRFNFYLSPEISNYLKQIAKKQNISRSAFIRNLLKEHMDISNTPSH